MKARIHPIVNTHARIALLLLSLTALAAFCAGAPPPQTLPDVPGAYTRTEIPYDPLRATSERLPEITATVEGGRSFSRETASYLTVINDPRGILARIDLKPKSQDNDSTATVRLFLHGQKKETVAIQPGAYVLHLAFWLPDQSFPVAYPHTSDFELQTGQTATIDITRQHYDAIRPWLKAIEEKERKKQ